MQTNRQDELLLKLQSCVGKIGHSNDRIMIDNSYTMMSNFDPMVRDTNYNRMGHLNNNRINLTNKNNITSNRMQHTNINNFSSNNETAYNYQKNYKPSMELKSTRNYQYKIRSNEQNIEQPYLRSQKKHCNRLNYMKRNQNFQHPQDNQPYNQYYFLKQGQKDQQYGNNYLNKPKKSLQTNTPNINREQDRNIYHYQRKLNHDPCQFKNMKLMNYRQPLQNNIANNYNLIKDRYSLNKSMDISQKGKKKEYRCLKIQNSNFMKENRNIRKKCQILKKNFERNHANEDEHRSFHYQTASRGNSKTNKHNKSYNQYTFKCINKNAPISAHKVDYECTKQQKISDHREEGTVQKLRKIGDLNEKINRRIKNIIDTFESHQC